MDPTTVDRCVPTKHRSSWGVGTGGDSPSFDTPSRGMSEDGVRCAALSHSPLTCSSRGCNTLAEEIDDEDNEGGVGGENVSARTSSSPPLSLCLAVVLVVSSSLHGCASRS